jgi:hypothetical protein
MPEPIITPITIISESKNPSPRTKCGDVEAAAVEPVMVSAIRTGKRFLIIVSFQ